MLIIINKLSVKNRFHFMGQLIEGVVILCICCVPRTTIKGIGRIKNLPATKKFCKKSE